MAALALGSAVWAEESGTRPEQGARVRPGGERGPRPEPVKLTAEQQAALQPAIDKLKAALTEFKVAVTATLGEQDARRFIFQTIMETLRPAGERGPRPESARRGEGVRRPRKEGGEAVPPPAKAGGEGDAQGF
jgi:hypothetical protein